MSSLDLPTPLVRAVPAAAAHRRLCFIAGEADECVRRRIAAAAEAGLEVHLISRRGQPMAGAHLHTLADSALAAQPPEGIEAYQVPEARFAFAACERVRELSREAPLAYIECDEAGGCGYFIVQRKRLVRDFADAVVAVRRREPTARERAIRNEQHWLDLGTALVQRMEDDARAGADTVFHEVEADSQVSAAAAVRPVPETQRFIFIGPVEHRFRCDVFLRAACNALRRGSDAKFHVFGPDTPTGPLGRSCWERAWRHVPRDLQEKFQLELTRSANAADVMGAVIVCPGEAPPPPLNQVMIHSAGTLAAQSTGNQHLIAHPRATDIQMGCVPAHVNTRFDTDEAITCEIADHMLAWHNREQQSAQQGAQQGEHRPAESSIGKSPSNPADPPPSDPLQWLHDALTRGCENARRSVPAAGKALKNPPASAPGHPAVSIVIPFYNLAEFLPATLESVRAQTWSDFEILIVDDGSTDPAAIALLNTLEHTENGAPLRMLRKANGGLGAARNFGLRNARAPWVLILDADDLLHPTYLAKAIAIAHRDPGIAAVGSLMRCFAEEPQVSTGGWIPLGLDRDLLASMNVGCTATCLINREAVLGVGGYDEYLVSFEDWDLWCRFAELNMRVEIIPEYLLYYRQRPDSMYHALARQNEAALRMYLLAKHPNLCRDWTRAMRIEVAMRHHIELGDGRFEKPLRYVVADKFRDTARKIGLGGVLDVIKKTR